MERKECPLYLIAYTLIWGQRTLDDDSEVRREASSNISAYSQCIREHCGMYRLCNPPPPPPSEVR